MQESQGEALVHSVSQFLWRKHAHYDEFHANDMLPLVVGLGK